MFVFTDLKFTDLSQRLRFSDFLQFCKRKTFLMLRCSGTQVITILCPKKLQIVLVQMNSKKKKKAVLCSACPNIIGQSQPKSGVSNFKAVTFNHCQACCSLCLHVRFVQFSQNKYFVSSDLQEPRFQKKQDHVGKVGIAAETDGNGLALWPVTGHCWTLRCMSHFYLGREHLEAIIGNFSFNETQNYDLFS